MEIWLPFIGEYGFPIVVTLYLLHRVEKKLDAVNQSVVQLPERIAQNVYFRNSDQKKSVM